MMHDVARWLSCIQEFRSRFLRCAGVYLVCFLLCLMVRNQIYTYCAYPVWHYLTMPREGMIATSVFAPMWVPMKAAAYVAALLVLPYFFYQFWSFVAPALYRGERKVVALLCAMSLLLFIAGVLVGALGVFPVMVRLMHAALPTGVMMMLDMSTYLSHLMTISMGFGVIFQVPVLVVTVLSTGICTLAQCLAWRRYWIVAAFVIAAILSPPDVLSQCFFAIPLCLLYELGILFYRLAWPWVLLGKR